MPGWLRRITMTVAVLAVAAGSLLAVASRFPAGPAASPAVVSAAHHARRRAGHVSSSSQARAVHAAAPPAPRTHGLTAGTARVPSASLMPRLWHSGTFTNPAAVTASSWSPPAPESRAR
jgi:hypothetical protein